MEPQRKPFSPQTLGDYWGCTDQHVRNLIAAGKLPAFHLGKLIRIRAADVERYEEQECQESSAIANSGASTGENQERFAGAFSQMNSASRLRQSKTQSG